MLSPFREHIRRSLADDNLQAALDANARRRVEGRERAFASLPDAEERRDRAHEARREIIANLDDILHRFLDNVEKNGISLHRARDAAEAVAIALDILRRTNPDGALIAKSKSMVTEEIGLNRALQAAGHRVVETDLGEFIVQLRGERPSHIITPAVHLRRGDVAALFEEKLNLPYTEDISALTDAARRELREVFLSADAGISGVNFGIAETGALCIVTNEGNGRMVTTMPRVHIAFMGLERLVRDVDDAALLLSLLPRSATGQQISVYTQFIRAPLPEQERHLILLDNGRTALRGSPLEDSLYCIRCGACLNVCPVFREIGGHAYVGADGAPTPYPGPIGSVISPGLFGGNYAPLAQACTLCGACREACPVRLDLPKMLLRVRNNQLPEGKRAPSEGAGLPSGLQTGLTLYRYAATHPRFYAFSQRVMGFAARALRSEWISLPAWTGWGANKKFPKPAAESFRARWKRKKIQPHPPARPHSGDPAAPRAPSERQKPEDMIRRFEAELTALDGKVHPVSQENLREEILSFLRERGIRAVLADEAAESLLAGSDIAAKRAADSKLRAGISYAAAGVAELGAVLLLGADRETLAASLLPNIHLAILRRSDLYLSLEEVLRLPALRDAPAAALVAGPSRTADIEMTLTIGVHGPGELILFLVDG